MLSIYFGLAWGQAGRKFPKLAKLYSEYQRKGKSIKILKTKCLQEDLVYLDLSKYDHNKILFRKLIQIKFVLFRYNFLI